MLHQHPDGATRRYRDHGAACTRLIKTKQTEIDQKVTELGGIHKYDLTPDVTHLIVGDYDTPKYRHVARERLDIKAMDALWIEELADIWKFDEELDFPGLEAKHRLKPLAKRGRVATDDSAAESGSTTEEQSSLLICLTGFGDQRDQIAERITLNGARYTGDLTRKCSHLIVSTPTGKKFTAAKAWGVRTVTLGWLDQTLERGMILDENKFDPLLPADEQGVNAWVKHDVRRQSFGKRSRSSDSAAPEDGTRKLRKTASMKLSSQRNTLWDNILGRSDSKEYSFSETHSGEQQSTTTTEPKASARVETQPAGIFSDCRFYIHGFPPQQAQVLVETISSLAGTICPSLGATAASQTAERGWRLLIVPQTSQPQTHPQSQDADVHVVTEFYIERCLQNKCFYRPDDHALGRPFPSFPIPGFEALTICSSAFTGLELNQVARSIRQLGASFEEQFRKETSILVCRSITAMRQDKLRYAVQWHVPIVSADWLWECISTGFNVPPDDFIFPEVRKHYSLRGKEKKSDRKAPDTKATTRPTGRHDAASRPPNGSGMDKSAFDSDSPKPTKSNANAIARHHEATTSADFVTAPTNASGSAARHEDTSLSELSAESLNKPPSPTKSANGQLPRQKSAPTANTGNEKPRQQRAPSAPPAVQGDENMSEDSHEQKARDDSRRAARAAERQQLTSKITNLLDSAKDEVAMQLDAPSAGTALPHKPRKRQILGRATSNVSNVSSGDCAYASEVSRPLSVVDGTGEGEFGEEEERQALGTQLEYGDPQARERKAQLMSRMMQEPVEGEAQHGDAGEGRKLRKRG